MTSRMKKTNSHMQKDFQRDVYKTPATKVVDTVGQGSH
jgi:hypothetical protein